MALDNIISETLISLYCKIEEKSVRGAMPHAFPAGAAPRLEETDRPNFALTGRRGTYRGGRGVIRKSEEGSGEAWFGQGMGRGGGHER
jgi:hypothetical protein